MGEEGREHPRNQGCCSCFPRTDLAHTDLPANEKANPTQPPSANPSLGSGAEAGAVGAASHLGPSSTASQVLAAESAEPQPLVLKLWSEGVWEIA